MDVVAFTPGSLAYVRMPPVAGRMFGARDTPAACKVVLVNEEAAALFDGNAVGRSLEDPAGERVEIIGVVSSHKIKRATAPSRPTIYYYAEQTQPPLGRTGMASFRAPVLPKPAGGALDANTVSASYFDVMGLSPTAGRVFTETPTRHGCRVGVINEETAALYFGGHAVGGAVIDSVGQRTEIVAVIHSALLRTSQRRVEPAMYLPMGQDFVPRMTLIVGARGSADATVAAVRRLIEDVPGGNPDRMVVTSLDEYLSRTALAPERIATLLVGASAALALTLSLIGMYGAMAEAARQRRREIALRLALGAQSWRVIRQVLAEGVRLAGIGTVAGVLGSFLASRWLARITPSAVAPAPWVWLAAPVLLVMVVGMASIMPACRALTVDLLTLMRDE
jgi:putative ABC transport system permease protein